MLARWKAVFVLAAALAALPVSAQAPRILSVQGRLANAAGAAKPDGSYSLTFRLYTAPTGGTALWAEMQPSVPVSKSVFSAGLGAVTSLAALHFDAPYYLSVQAGTDAEMTPRIPLLSAPYAIALPAFRTETTTGNDPNVIGGLAANTAAGVGGAAIAGGGAVGFPNTVNNNYGAIAGGFGNTASYEGAVGGGGLNTASGSASTVAGGIANSARGAWASIGGGLSNQALGDFSTVAGGGQSDPNDGTTGNMAVAPYCTVGGGGHNVAGDASNTADPSVYATVAGGLSNDATGKASAIGGGEGNSVPGFWSVIGGGYHNTVTESTATIPGGSFCTAGGYLSFAAGRSAHAMHEGSFVWGDSHLEDIASTRANELTLRALGGIRLVTNVDTANGNGFGTGAVTSFFTLNPLGNANGHFLDTSTGAYLTTGGMWTNSSDRSVKTNVVPVDAESVLRRVASMPVATWSYKNEGTGVRHIGPMAQDFAAAFHVGQDDRHIGTVDADGVALAAIQALYKENRAKDAKMERLEKQNAAMAARLSALEKAMMRKR